MQRTSSTSLETRVLDMSEITDRSVGMSEAELFEDSGDDERIRPIHGAELTELVSATLERLGATMQSATGRLSPHHDGAAGELPPDGALHGTWTDRQTDRHRKGTGW